MLGKITCRLEKPAEKKNKSDWEHFTWNFSNLAEQQREDTLRIRHEGRTVRNQTGIHARWETYRNNNRIRDRITEIDNWRVALEQTVSAIDLEIKKVEAAKEAVEQAIEVKVMDLDIVNEIMTIREQRRGNDYIVDEAQMELAKVWFKTRDWFRSSSWIYDLTECDSNLQETCLIKDARNLLEKKAQEAWHQIARLQEVRQQILRDLNEKILGLDIDRYLLNLNESSSEISFRPDPLRVPKGMITPQAWEEQSRYNKIRADCELATSIKLRESMLLTIDQTYNDIRSQREATDFAMRKRQHEVGKSGDDLQHQRQKVKESSVLTSVDIQLSI